VAAIAGGILVIAGVIVATAPARLLQCLPGVRTRAAG
jgi:hypothetical protein